MKSVLMVAYHYPPEGSSSGVQRTLAFSRYLPENGWTPLVLTANPRVYRVVRNDQMDDIPTGTIVHRALALDAQRHLSLFGRYPGFLSLPDPWSSWWFAAVVSGLRLVRKHRPTLIWSTYPIATAHLVALSLHRLTGLPWVSDFRDSMTEDDYPSEKHLWRVYRWIEKRTVTRCRAAVFTTPGARSMYASRYPEISSDRMAVIPNGYDEDAFVAAAKSSMTRSRSEQIVLVHSGSLYRSERDPRCFFAAVAQLLDEGRITPQSLRIVLRATGQDEHYRKLIDERGVGGVVSLEGALPYREALAEMMSADGLLLFQAASCNHQIPAKVYEYFRAGRPIFAMTDPRGDTAETLRAGGLDAIVPLDDIDAIKNGLVEFVQTVRSGEARVATLADSRTHSRRARTSMLASLLDRVVSASRV